MRHPLDVRGEWRADIGEYEYFCLPHPWMKAKVIVEE
jgi:plastocyanin